MHSRLPEAALKSPKCPALPNSHEKGALRNLGGDIARMQQFVGTWLGATAEDMQLDTASASSPIRQASVRLTANEPGPWLGVKQMQKAYGPAGRMRPIAAVGIRSDITQHPGPIEPRRPCKAMQVPGRSDGSVSRILGGLHLSHSRAVEESKTDADALEFQASHFLIGHLQVRLCTPARQWRRWNGMGAVESLCPGPLKSNYPSPGMPLA